MLKIFHLNTFAFLKPNKPYNLSQNEKKLKKLCLTKQKHIRDCTQTTMEVSLVT